MPDTGIATVNVSPDGHTRTYFLDVRTGKPLGKPVMHHNDDRNRRRDHVTPISEDLYVRTEVGKGRCAAELSAHQIRTHRKLWGLTPAALGEDESSCEFDWHVSVPDGDRLLVRTPQRTPILLEAATGKFTWAGERKAAVVGVTEGVVVAGNLATSGPTKPAFTALATNEPVPTSEAALAAAEHTAVWDVKLGRKVDTVEAAHGVIAYPAPVTGDALALYDLRTRKKRVCAGANLLMELGEGWLLARHQRELRLFTL